MSGRTVGAYQSEQVTRERFVARQLRHPGGCWEWMGTLSPFGYGALTWRGKRWAAHRLALVFDGQELEEGKIVDHICRNRRCVNPAHLRQVTPRQNAVENSAGPVAANAAKMRCLRGHELVRTVRGSRRCPICEAMHAQRAAKRKARLKKLGLWPRKTQGKPWPRDAEFLGMVDELGVSEVGRRLGFTRQAVSVRNRRIRGGEALHPLDREERVVSEGPPLEFLSEIPAAKNSTVRRKSSGGTPPA